MNTTVTQIKNTEDEAAILLEHALELAKVSTGDDLSLKLQALDRNLKLWVQIETSMRSGKNLLPQEIKDNLLKLSKFVEHFILSKGVAMTKADFDCLININTQISAGLLEAVKNKMAQEEAFSLVKCAVDLSAAKENKNEAELVTALENNLQLWVYIKTLASSQKSQLPGETKDNLVKLADYVSSKTLEVGRNISENNDVALESMIMTNLQISEGLISQQKIA